MKVKVHIEGAPQQVGAAVHILASGGGMLYLQQAPASGPVTTAVALVIGASLGQLAAAFAARPRP